MRQIKFRGKRISTGEWVYGDLLTTHVIDKDADKEYTRYEIRGFQPNFGPVYFTVDFATVGQLTGLQDCHGTEIYEGDILGDVKFPKATPLICEFRHGAFGYEYCGDFHPWGGNTNFTFNPFDKDSRFEIIGNIHDNPELMKGGDQ